MKRWRIVYMRYSPTGDNFYIVQWRWVFFPVWFIHDGGNKHITLDKAKSYLEGAKKGWVVYG